MPDGVVNLRSRADTSGVTQLDAAYKALTATERRAVSDTLSLAQAYARLDAAQGRPAQGAALLRNEYAQLSAASGRQAVAIQTQIASLDRLGGSSSSAAQFTRGLKSGLLGIVGPAALAATAIGAVKGAIDFSEDAFKLKAAVDQTNLSIRAQLHDFRNTNAVLQEGQRFAERYKLTQVENAEAIQASIPILRQSKASLTEVESTLLRLAVLKPEQGIQGAAFALAELAGGQSRSLATRFNIPISKANELKKAIQQGGDAVQVLGKYLDSIGIGMDVLDTRTKGATGKMNELAVETERFSLALGEQATGPGLAILNARIGLAQQGTRLLHGEWSAFSTTLNTGISRAIGNTVEWLKTYNLLAVAIRKARGESEPVAPPEPTGQGQAGVFGEAARGVASRAKTAADAVQNYRTELSALRGEVIGSVVVGLNAQAKAISDLVQRQQIAVSVANQQTAGMDAYAASNQRGAVTIQSFYSEIQTSAQASVLDAAKKEAQAAATRLMQAETQQAADAFLRLNPGIDASGIAAAVAAGKIPLETGALAALEQQTYKNANAFRDLQIARGAADLLKPASLEDRGPKRPRGVLDLFGGGSAAATGAAMTQEEEAQLHANLSLLRAKKDYNGEIALLRQQQRGLNQDSAEYKNLEAQIIDVQNQQEAAGKRHTGELGKQLNLNERIRDSIESQYKASLDIAELSARDRLDRIKERQELAAAQRILASGSTSAAQKEAAAAKIDLINAQQAKRALEISEKQATAGGTIINGRVFQSVPGGGAPAGAVPRAVGPIAPVAAGGPAPAPAAGGAGPLQAIINLDGKTIAQVEFPYIVAMLVNSQRQANAAGRGSGT